MGIATHVPITGDDMPRTDDLAAIFERIPVFAGRRFEGLAVARLASLTNRTYRIGVGTNWIDDPAAGDVFAFSSAVVVRG